MPIDREDFTQYLREREYHTALICENGHVLSSNLEGELNPPSHCPDCGTQALRQCTGCGKPIRGQRYTLPGFTLPGFAPWPRPAFCHACGEAFLWTEAQRQALLDLVDEAEGLGDDDRKALREILPDLGIEGPRTRFAALRALSLLRKLGGGVKDAVYRAMVDICSETAAKILKPGGPSS